MSEVKLYQGIIYMIDSYDPEVKGYYVGSTLQTFSQRRIGHTYDCNNIKSTKYNHYKYVYMRENGGWLNFKMTIIDRVIVESDEELRIIEQDWIDTIKPNLNTKKAYITKKEININRVQIIQCDHCNKTYTKDNKTRHQKSKYCINYISN